MAPTDAIAAATTGGVRLQVWITRPEREAVRWVAQLQALGFDARALPMIVIAPVPESAAVAACWRRLGDYRAAMFVSPAAAQHFFAAAPAGETTLPPGLRLWAPGPGTARALRAAGVEGAWIDSPPADATQFDSEALWQAVRSQVRPGDTVLVVRGTTVAPGPAGSAAPSDASGYGREWMAAQLAAAGAAVQYCVAYRRLPPPWSAELAGVAAAVIPGATAAVFSSSEAVAHWTRLLPDLVAGPTAPVAVCTHPRIAEAARAAGFRRVLDSRPTVDAVAASLRQVGPAAP